MQLNVKNETSTLKAVVLGQPGSIGKVPTLEETYDAKSYESVLHNIYPHEEDIFKEMRCFESVLLKYGVQVYRPWTLENCNQVFARDVGFTTRLLFPTSSPTGRMRRKPTKWSIIR